jgi:hypothetical protein
MFNIEKIGCTDGAEHTPHFLNYIGYATVTCAGTQPPAEITYTPSSAIIEVALAATPGHSTTDSYAQKICLAPEDQYLGGVPIDNITMYVAGARIAHERNFEGILAATQLGAILRQSELKS